MFVQSQTDSGIRIIAETIPYLRSVSMGVWIKTGSAYEVEEINGASHFLEHLFFKGTARRSARELAECIEGVGGTANAFTSRECTCLYATVLDEHLDLAIDLLSDIMLNSTFADLEKERQVVIEEIGSTEDSPEDYVHDLFTAQIWKDHPLGLPVVGEREAVNALTLERIRAYFDEHYFAENIIISIAGNIDPNAIIDDIARAFEGIPEKGSNPGYSTPSVLPEITSHRKRLSQTHFCVGFPGISACDPRRFAFNILGNLLGGTSMSRLFQKIREDQGLAYCVYAFFDVLAATGMIGVYAAVAPKRTAQTLEIVMSELRKVREKLAPLDELHRTKEQLKGSITLNLESTFNRMVRLAKGILLRDDVCEIDELLTKIAGVSAEEVRELAAELFCDSGVNLVSLGPTRKLALESLET
ncbi:M16 family metallopeptidase [Candidatus Hydrogenedentota bacterium]